MRRVDGETHAVNASRPIADTRVNVLTLPPFLSAWPIASTELQFVLQSTMHFEYICEPGSFADVAIGLSA